MKIAVVEVYTSRITQLCGFLIVQFYCLFNATFCDRLHKLF
jgi:hypothetical protein